jgi:2-dehydropantoate 2-reductase
MKTGEAKVLIFGAGAIGGSIGGWLSQEHEETYLYARGEHSRAMREKGLILYDAKSPEKRERIPVKVIESLSDLPDVDIVAIAVKLYQLDSAVEEIKAQYDDSPIILGLQNGVANQKILPENFSKVVFGIIPYNAWIDQPGIIGYQQEGSVLLGIRSPRQKSSLKEVAKVLQEAILVHTTGHIEDAAHCKLAVNLSNAVTALAGYPQRQITNLDQFQMIISNTIYEGVQVIKAAGYQQVELDNIPSWMMIWAAARLPLFLTRGIFKSNIKKSNRSSMSQDVLDRKRQETELEYLNGYIIQLAERFRVAIPYNRTIYRLTKERLAREIFEPMPVEEIFAAIQSGIYS